MKQSLIEFVSMYQSQITEEEYESFLSDINNDYYSDTCEIADELEDMGVNLDTID